MNTRPELAKLSYHSLPHGIAKGLVCVVFPLIWVGGLVTTYDAGMAVPDWPGTYGYNLFLYPWTTWLFGPFNLFIEHGHRLLGATAGMVTIAFVLAVYCQDSRRFMTFAAGLALALVISQGILGGLRVRMKAETIALIHGCVGPAFFAWCAACATLTSRDWFETHPLQNASSVTRSSLVGLLLVYLQLVLGAIVRHPSDDGSPALFRLVLMFHVFVGLAVVGHILGLAIAMHRKAAGVPWLQTPTRWLLALASLQIVLGLATLVAKYGWLTWLGGEWFAPNYTVQAKNFWGAMIVTSHVANGSLILALLAVLTARCSRACGWGHASVTNMAFAAKGVLA